MTLLLLLYIRDSISNRIDCTKCPMQMQIAVNILLLYNITYDFLKEACVLSN